MPDPYIRQEVYDLAAASVEQEYLGNDEDERMRYLEQLVLHIEKSIQDWWAAEVSPQPAAK